MKTILNIDSLNNMSIYIQIRSLYTSKMVYFKSLCYILLHNGRLSVPFGFSTLSLFYPCLFLWNVNSWRPSCKMANLLD